MTLTRARATPGSSVSSPFENLLQRCQQMFSSPTGICLVLAAVTLFCYWPVTHHQFINYDDHEYITENRQVQAGLTWAGVAWAFRTTFFCSWHPLTWLSHMADCSLYGLNPGGHHFTSCLLHIANTLVLFLLLNRITGAKWRSAIVAAFFAWHPLHVESVAWVSERKDVLSTFFFLLTLGAYARYVESKAPSPKSKVQSPRDSAEEPYSSPSHSPSSILFFLLALFLFALALMSKPMVVTLPFILLLLDFWPLGRISDELLSLRPSLIKIHAPAVLRLVLEKVPFFLVAMATCVVTFIVQRDGGAMSSMSNIPLSLRVTNALMAYLRYLSKTLIPVNLSPFYPYRAHWPVLLVIFASLLLLGLTLAFILNARRRPYLIAGWFWFIGTLVPVIGLVQVGSQSMADRYMYIPSIGLFVILVWGMNDLRSSFPIRLPVLAGSGAAALLACLAVTKVQLQHWQNGLSLFQHTLDVSEGNYFAYCFVGKAYDDAGQKEKALAYYSESVRLSPHYVEGQYNLGTLLLDMGRTDEAIKLLTGAISDDPHFARAYNNLGKALLAQGLRQDAINRYAQAVKLAPDWPEAHYNLGTALLTESRPAEAIAEFSQALRLNSRYADAHMNFAIACISLSRTTEALPHFAEAVRLAPENPEARFNFGLALLERNKPTEAATQFASGLRLRPDDARMQSRLAQALASASSSAEANGSLGSPGFDAAQAPKATFGP